MNLWQDIRYGARTLRKSPGFALTAIVTLALGIGATTAIFSVCDAMLWKPVPLPRIDSLVMVLERDPGDPNDWNPVTPADFDDIARSNNSFERIAAWEDGRANIVGAGGEPERVSQYLVTANFFDVMGVKPARGRAFQPGEDQPGREREVILSDALWRRSFAADARIVGKTILLDDEKYEVTGIMPPNFRFPVTAELWTPLALKPADRNSRKAEQLVAIGILKSGRTPGQAAAEIDTIAKRLERQYPDTNKNRRFLAQPTHDFIIGSYNHQYSLMLFGAALFVLLIACANVANLLFARGSGRLREVAVRTALGAGRARVIAQLLTESVLVSLAGALLGLVVANWGIALIRGNMPPEVEKYIWGWKDIGLDVRAMAFAAASAVVTGILAGLAPAWQASRPNLHESLKDGGRGSSVGRGRRRLRAALVSTEIALAVVLLVGAGLMVRGFNSLLRTGASLDPSTLLTMRLAITDNKYHEPHQIEAFYRAVLERTSAIPGVTSAVAVTSLPYSQHSSGRAIVIEGKQPQPGEHPGGQYQVTSPNYFETMHIPLLAGRLLSNADVSDALPAAVISERMAKRWWPGEPWPIGKRFRADSPIGPGRWVTVVGVVGDVVHSVYDRGPRAAIYVPYMQAPRLWMDIAIRTSGDPARFAKAAIGAIRSVDPEQPVTDVLPLDKLIQHDAVGLAYVAVLMGIFGLVALALSSIGVYGVMAYMVAEQTHEIGIRMALGAGRDSVLGMVFRRGMITTAAGLAAGLALGYAMARAMQALIYGVTTSDPATFIGIPLALCLSAALAIYIPARRAMRIDPIIALRYE